MPSRHDAACDADRVAAFLGQLGLRPPPGQVLPLPAAFLLDLGAALRLLVWEEAGLQPHEVPDCPGGKQALHDILGSLSAYATGDKRRDAPATLIPRVLAAFVDHFAWHRRAELNADLTLAEADEEAILEALADFLWTHRPR